MTAKEKIIGLVLIVMGLWPMLVKIEAIANAVAKQAWLSHIIPAQVSYVYQAILIVLGVLLLWRRNKRTSYGLGTSY